MAGQASGGEDGWISEESNFCGDEETREALEQQIRNSKPTEFLDVFKRYPNNLAARVTSENENDQKAASDAKPNQWFEGDKAHRQPNETVKRFLKRMPPLTTVGSTVLPWLFVDGPDPHVDESTERDLGKFTELGVELQNQFMEQKRRAETADPNRPKQTITKMLKPDRDALVEGIRAIAKENGILFGKWMLFPPLEDLPRIWRKVCEGVIAGQLGPQAKVATADFEGDPKIRVICIYTKDFDNQDDVLRVLLGLKDLGIVSETDSRGIYYKADAYTYLDIKSDNPFGIRASMYSSRDVLKAKELKRGRADTNGMGGKTGKKQVTLSQFMK
ncbi:DUF1917-domain-containing protein [Eremomyces bilateralis CBS 781.70]|uniref:DUF1917-domain-containing protein n=1 Tax=Eremomyces bilateralis CBS 781.70 TaxID=1392243 RepID=A0A6G1FYH1_9PEZI|nr:DUF1917-domain-containing protein [Eremomyces bilateralis CBS 781.70]KAF1810915.1 DUF1917-domain-containing protein [Eremomyces bilateralis CBS 781.70]